MEPLPGRGREGVRGACDGVPPGVDPLYRGVCARSLSGGGSGGGLLRAYAGVSEEIRRARQREDLAVRAGSFAGAGRAAAGKAVPVRFSRGRRGGADGRRFAGGRPCGG